MYTLASLLLLLAPTSAAAVPQTNYLRTATTTTLSSETDVSSASSGSYGSNILSESDMMSLMMNEFWFEPWVPDKNAFKHDPMEYFTEENLRTIPGVDEYTDTSGGPLVVDMVDRFLKRGYISTEFSSLLAFQQWVVMNSNADPTFRVRYAFLPKPTVSYGSFFWGGSAGLEAGSWRTISLGNAALGLPVVEWKETIMVFNLVTFPGCVETPLDSATSTSQSPIFVMVAGQRKIFYESGSTITEAVDPLGNHYFLYATRGPGPNPTVPTPNGPMEINTLPPGWTLNRNRVLPNDYTSQCLHSKSIPKNKNGDEGVVCKEVQFTDLSGSVFRLAEFNGDKDYELPVGNLLVTGGASPTCAPFVLTGDENQYPF